MNKLSDFKVIDDIFADMKKGKNSSSTDLSSELSRYFNKNIRVKITPSKRGDSVFVMNVTPDTSVIDKVLKYMTTNESKLQAICDVWNTCKDWTLDIDKNILGILSPQELTALTLHEAHHIMDSDRIPKRLVNVVQFGIADSKISHKAVLQNQNFNKILQIPVLSACQSFFDVNDMKKEIKANRAAMKKEKDADKYAASNGYLTHLLSAIEKVSKLVAKNQTTAEQNTKDALNYSLSIIDNLELRKKALVKEQLSGLKKYLPDTTFKESVDEIYESWFSSEGEFNYITESVNKIIEDTYFTEFGIGRKLAPIERNQLDYIAVKIESMATINDKMMILSYINSKLELIDYYIDVLSDKKLSKKYKVPHSLEQLEYYKEILNRLRERALNTKIGSGERELVVYYPKGYEG